MNGCLLLTLTSAHRVAIYEPLLNPVTMNWNTIQDVSDLILEHYNFNASSVEKSKANLDKLETTGKHRFSYILDYF